MGFFLQDMASTWTHSDP